jgi:hypothetical protein
VTVSFSKYLPWQAMHFLQRSTHFSKTCCRPLITSKFLASELFFVVGKDQKSHGARSELNSVFFLEKVDRWNPIRTSIIQSRSRPMRFLGFSNHEKWAPKFRSDQTVCSTFSRSGWSVVRSASLAKGPSPHLDKVQTWSNKVSPRNLQRPSYISEFIDLNVALYLRREVKIAWCESGRERFMEKRHGIMIDELLLQYKRPFRLSTQSLAAHFFR